MTTKTRHTLMLGALLLLSGGVHAADAEGLVGYWRTIDDRTGFARGVVHIQQARDGSYVGVPVMAMPRPGYTPKEFCVDCPPPYTGKRIMGLTVLTGLRAADTPNQYVDGRLLDPLSGRIYRCKAKLSPDGRRLTMRGYVGVSMLGRSQSWIRETDPQVLEEARQAEAALRP
jgi:hypothetical protein